MVFAMRHGVLFYEAMGLFPSSSPFCFGVFIYEATRPSWRGGDSSGNVRTCSLGFSHPEEMSGPALTKMRRPALIIVLSLLLVGCGGKEAPVESTVRTIRAMKVGDLGELAGRSFPGRVALTPVPNF